MADGELSQTAAGAGVASVPEVDNVVVVSEELQGPPSSNSSDDELVHAGALRSAVVRRIQDQVCLPFQTPLVRAGPRLRRSRTPITPRSLRRSSRIAARPRAGNATIQAQKVLLRKLGVQVGEDEVDSQIQQKFRAAFRGDMTESKQQALHILLNVEGLEGELA